MKENPAMKFTPASYEGEHLVLLPAGMTGTVTLADGTTVDLGPAGESVISVDSHDQAKEVAFLASEQAGADESMPDVAHDAALSRKNLGMKKES